MNSRPYLLEVQSGGNGADSTGVMSLVMLIGYFAIMARLMSPMLSQINWIGEDGTDNIIVVPTDVVPSEYNQKNGYTGVQVYQTPTVALYPTSTIAPTYTPYPTLTPYPTFTPGVDWLRGSPTPTRNAFEPYQVNWVFSYYNPDLVAQRDENPSYEVNCHIDNWIWNEQGTKVIGCKDTTASGLPWSKYLLDQAQDYRGGVAVPYHPNTCHWDEATKTIIGFENCQPIYPMGAVIRVSAPPELVGDYLVIDECPGCFNFIYSHNVLFLDFLAEGLPYGVDFWSEIEVSEVIYP